MCSVLPAFRCRRRGLFGEPSKKILQESLQSKSCKKIFQENIRKCASRMEGGKVRARNGDPFGGKVLFSRSFIRERVISLVGASGCVSGEAGRQQG
jgi:hypothetical protein